MRWILFPLVFLLAAGAAAETDGLRWQKVDASGAPLPVSGGPWFCVMDHKTGLLWEVKTDNEGLRHAPSTYSWFDGQAGSQKRGSCVLAPHRIENCDTHDHVMQLRAQNFCGRDDWRMPSARELESLLFDTGFAGYPRIALGFFPHTGQAAYWSADSRRLPGGEPQAMAVHFASGVRRWLPADRVARLRLVSGTSSGETQVTKASR